MRMKKLIAVMMTVLLFLCVSVPSVSRASVLPPTAEEVFPEDEVAALWDLANSKPMTQRDGISTMGSGYYPTRAGSILVTDDKYMGIIPSGHAGIVYNSSTVVESLEDGVIARANKWDEYYTTCTGLDVIRTNASQESVVASWAHRQVGKDYNFDFYNVDTRSVFYCSQLVWAAYLDNYGIDLDTDWFGEAIHPAELIITSETTVTYRK